MKKLLIAMMSVASLAFISKAEAINSGTTFENYTGAFGADKDDVGGNNGTFWYTAGSQSECGTLTNIDYTATYSSAFGRPAIAQGAATATALAVEAEQRLERGIANYSGGFAPQDIGSGIYFDTMVQFTATDIAPTPSQDDKLIVWLYGSADEDSAFGIRTNLVVTAGYVTGAAQTSTPSNYIVSATGIDVQPNTWHRLTIKSIADIGDNDGVAGFVVFIDGVPMTCSDEKGDTDSVFGALNSVAAKWNNTGALFPSLVVGTLTAQKLSSVALEGTGMIDDISFTSVAPQFAKDSDFFTINWDDHVTGLVITVGETETTLTAEQVAAKTYGIEIDGTTTVAVAPTFAADYAKDAWTVTGEATETATANTFTVTGTATATLVSKETVVRAYLTMGGETVEYSTLNAAIAVLEALTPTESGTKATLKLNAAVVGNGLFSNVLNPDLTLDLNGFTITGDAETATAEDCVVDNECVMVIIDTSAAKTGKILAVNGQLAVFNGWELTINEGKFNGGINSYIDGPEVNPKYDPDKDQSARLTVNGGYFTSKPTAKEVVLKQGFTWTASPDENGYYTLTAGEGPDPEPTTYALTIPEVTGATAAVTKDGVAVTDLTKIAEGTTVVVTWTAKEGYKITAGATETITMDAAKEATAPTVQAIQYATVTITQVDNCTITVKNGDADVATGAKFDIDDKVILTVTRTPADGYELDNCQTPESVTLSEAKEYTITAAVKPVSSGKTYPTYIPAGASEATKAKFDTWSTSKAGGDRDTASANMEAFLLNVAPEADLAAEKANFKVTAITVNADGSVTVTTTTENSIKEPYNGTPTVKGKVNLTDSEWLPKDDRQHRFFKAFLEVE